MKRTILITIALCFITTGCSSTANRSKPFIKTNAGSVNLAVSNINNNPEAEQALQHALALFQQKQYAAAEQAFWQLDQQYAATNDDWGIRVVSAALVCQLAMGDIHRFQQSVINLQRRAMQHPNPPRYTQALLLMATANKDGFTQANIDSRIRQWFSALQ